MILHLRAIRPTFIHTHICLPCSSLSQVLNYAFSFLWVAEAALKMYGFSPKVYFSFAWNIFDFSLVLTALVDVSLRVTADSLSEVMYIYILFVCV